MSDAKKSMLGALGPIGWVVLMAIYAKEQTRRKTK